jgi:hypothetical protein
LAIQLTLFSTGRTGKLCIFYDETLFWHLVFTLTFHRLVNFVSVSIAMTRAAEKFQKIRSGFAGEELKAGGRLWSAAFGMKKRATSFVHRGHCDAVVVVDGVDDDDDEIMIYVMNMFLIMVIMM